MLCSEKPAQCSYSFVTFHHARNCPPAYILLRKDVTTRAQEDAEKSDQNIILRVLRRIMRDCDDHDRDHFIEHRGDIFTVTQTDCLAWALLANPMRIILLRTDQAPIVTVMIGKKTCRNLFSIAIAVTVR